MQKFVLKFSGLALLFAALLFVGCGEDNPIIDNPLGPEINLSGDVGFLSSDTELEPGVAFSVRLDVLRGDNDLQSMTIFKGSAQLSTSEFTVTSIEQGALTSNNPFLITGSDADGGTFDITIIPTDADGDVSVYSFEITDTDGRTDETSIAISTIRLATALSAEYTTVVVNNADGPDNGGLDLDAGVNVPRASADAELIDNGIDINLPAADNWRQTVSPVNGTEMRIPDPSNMENFRYEDVDSREAIVAAWDTGADIATSDKLEAGDLLLLKSGDAYWLVEVGSVNVNTANNADFYEFNIKASKL